MDGLNAHGGDLDLRAALGALRRRKAVILATVLLLTAATVLVTMQITPRYTAVSSVLIEPAERRVVDLKAVATDLPGLPPGETSAIATQTKLLRSRSLARQVIAELELDRDSDSDPALHTAESYIGATVRDWVVDKWVMATGFAKQPQGPAEPSLAHVHGSQASPAPQSKGGPTQAVIDGFLERLNVTQEGESQIVSVTFSSTDPEEAARIVNTTVEFYLRAQLADKIIQAERAAHLVSERAGQLREEVLQAETAVGEYRAAHGLTDSRDGSLDAQQLTNVHAELTVAQAERTAKEARLDQARELRARGAHYESLSEVVSSPIILSLRQQQAELQREEAQLSKTYGDRHPHVIEVRAERENVTERIEHEIGNVIRNLENEVAVARIRERALEQALGQAKQQYAVAGRASVQLHELERVAAAKRLLYETFLARSKEIDEQRKLLEPDAKVIYSAAPPDEPSFPKLGVMTAAGFAASLVVGTALAGLLEHLDRGLRNCRQLEQVLGVPALGLVPRVGRSTNRQPLHRYLLDRPLSVYAEAIKAIQTAVQLSRPDMPPRVLLVTSAMPGEGKTTLATSLAVSFARSGHRTLLLDLDLRRPSVARKAGQLVEAGIVEFMLDERRLEDIVYEFSGDWHLHFIPVKGRTTSPADLLGSEKMRLLLAELRRRYDYIVLDSPPALGLADVRLTALLADAAIFVVRWENTSSAAAVNGLEALTKSRIPIAGAVLNLVDLRRHAKYGYEDVGQYYGSCKQYFIN